MTNTKTRFKCKDPLLTVQVGGKKVFEMGATIFESLISPLFCGCWVGLPAPSFFTPTYFKKSLSLHGLRARADFCQLLCALEVCNDIGKRYFFELGRRHVVAVGFAGRRWTRYARTH